MGKIFVILIRNLKLVKCFKVKAFPILWAAICQLFKGISRKKAGQTIVQAILGRNSSVAENVLAFL